MADTRKGEVAVLIPAAGQGKRLGGTRKQFRRLGGKPLLVQTLLLFERHPEIGHIVVSAPKETVDILRAELETAGLTKLTDIVTGGDTRQDSVAAALRVVPQAVDVILVHDAVRPFVEQVHISVVIATVRSEGAAALAIPVADTMRRGDTGQFHETVPRRNLYRMQTPQGFRKTWFEEAHRMAKKLHVQSTDDVDLVQHIGCPVQIVPGGSLNFKITTPDDWELATMIWPYWEQSHVKAT